MTFKNYLLFACMLLHCHLAIGQALPEPSLDQKTTELINQLYTVENFQARLGTKLDENQLFQTYQKEEAFYLDLVGLLRESALSAYATTIETAITTEMTEPQIDSLILALQSPYGNVIRKAFEIDNIRIDQQLDDYIDEVMNKAVEKRQVRDSLLYVTEFETDLKNMMDGTYTNMIADDKVVQIIRAGNQQLRF